MTQRVRTIAAGLMLATGLAAQTARLSQHDNTPEAQQIQAIGQESDPAAKLQKMEQFVQAHPKHASAAWVYGQMQASYAKAGQWDKAIAAGDQALALAPDDVPIAYGNLKAAEAKKDPDLVKKYASMTSEAARRVAKSTQPETGEDQESWKSRVDFAKQTDTYTEYSLFVTAGQSTDPKKTVELVDTLIAQNPNSTYLPQVYAAYFNALRQTGQGDKAAAMADQAVAKDPKNEEILAMAADAALQKKANDKAIEYSKRLVELMGSKPKPEGMSDADWEKRKTGMLGLGNWISGVAYNDKGDFVQVDKSMRAALPLVAGNDQLLSSTLFYLGVADYKLGSTGKNRAMLSDAAKFSEKAASMEGPYKEQAAKNLKAIRAEMARGGAAKKR